MAISRYLPHVVYSVALTSISFHLLAQRDTIDTERAQLAAQISVLESIVRQMHTPESISDAELERLRKLARAHREQADHVRGGGGGKGLLSWRDVFFRTEGGSKE